MKNNRTKTIAFSLILGVVFIFGMNSCETRITPNKVERVITKDSWSITLFLFQGQNIETNYTGKTLDFSENGVVSVAPFSGISGNWNAGLGKKPSLLYIGGFVDTNYFMLNDDWEITACSKSSIKLQSENGEFVNKITLTKVEE